MFLLCKKKLIEKIINIFSQNLGKHQVHITLEREEGAVIYDAHFVYTKRQSGQKSDT